MDLLDRKFAVCFGHLDADGSGWVDRADLDRIADQIVATFGVAADSVKGVAYRDGLMQFWDAVSAECDSDGDGRIDPQEYVRGMRAVVADPAKLVRGFRALGEGAVGMFDTDGDGVINGAEFAAGMAVFDVPAAEAAETFTLLDTNRDGLISAEEFGTAIQEYYTSTDPAAPGNYLYGRAFEKVSA